MRNVLLVIVVFFGKVTAKCQKNDLHVRRQTPTAGDRLLFSRRIESEMFNYLCWCSFEDSLTLISEVKVHDLIGGGLSAKPRIFAGGPNHHFVSIMFEKEHGLQVIDIHIEIWTYTPEGHVLAAINAPMDEMEGQIEDDTLEEINERIGDKSTLYLAKVFFL